METGRLTGISINPNYNPKNTGRRLDSWSLVLEFGPVKSVAVITDSRMALTLLQVGLLTEWDVEVITQAGTQTITRVRILDDRDCKPGLKYRDGQPVRPLTPTAFVDERPRKWGFFFQAGADCAEWKGTSLDVFRVVEFAWLQKKDVVLKLDDGDHIIGAELYIGD